MALARGFASVRHAGTAKQLVPLRRRSSKGIGTWRCYSQLASRVHELLDRTQWLLPDPAAEVCSVQQGGASFAVIRDDLLGHPFLGGNKFRKLDGLWAQLAPATDVVTCGGLQSAHAPAVAAACVQHGKRCHLLVRGERPAVPTGHHLFARLLAHRVEYVSRAQYADRDAMFAAYLQHLQQQETPVPQTPPGGASAAAAAVAAASSGGSHGGRHVAVLPEGGACAGALLGLIRLAAWLAGQPLLAGRRCNIVVDSGTGATATGLALGAALLRLHWRVTGVMLAAADSYYAQQQRDLTAAFCADHGMPAAQLQQATADRLSWVPRLVPRKFGKVLTGEVAACQAVAQRHGIVLDPIWTLAAWEMCCHLAGGTAAGLQDRTATGGQQHTEEDELVVMLHTGGSVLGLCGLAQRFPDQF